jgi:hypothetical protein
MEIYIWFSLFLHGLIWQRFRLESPPTQEIADGKHLKAAS